MSLPDVDSFLSQFSSPATRRTYKSTLLMFQDFIDESKNSSLSVVDFANLFIDARSHSVSPFTVARDGMAIKSYFYYRGIEWRRKFRGLNRKLRPWLSSDQVKTLVNTCQNPAERAIIMTLYDAALRIKELLGLELNDVHKEGFLSITRKGGSVGTVPISDNTYQAIMEYLKWRKVRVSTMRVFPLRYQEVLKMTKSLSKRSGIEFTPHKLRHSRASNLREQGVDIADIMALLGHKRIDTTMIYAHVTAGQLKQRIPAGT